MGRACRLDKAQMARLLREWGRKEVENARRRAQIEEWMAQAENAGQLQGRRFTLMPQGSEIGDPTGHAALIQERAMERAEQLTRELYAALERQAALEEALSRLPGPWRELLILHYQRKLPLTSAIPRRLHISERTARRWHDQSLRALCEKLAGNDRIYGVHCL